MAVYKDKLRKTWYVDLHYRDSEGIVKSKKKRGFETRKAAEAWEKSLKFDTVISQKFTFGEISSLYFGTRCGIANEATIRDQKNKLKKYVGELFKESLPIHSKTWLHWRNEIASTKLSSTTKNSIIKLIKAINRFGYLNYDIQDNAKGLANFMKPFDEQKEKRVMNYDEFEKFIKKIDNQVYRTFFEFCYFTGVRRSEALAIQKEDIDLTNKTVSINKSIPHRQVGSRRGLSSLKTPKSYRILKLDDELFDNLKPLINQDGPFIFGGYEPLSTSTITRRLKEGLKKAKLQDYTLHEFRHSNGSLLLDANIPLIKVSKRLGHSSVDVTARVYAHALKNVDDESADVFNQLRRK